MSDYIHIVTPLVRLVRGSLTERATHDYDNNPYEEGKGPFELGVALRKDDPNAADFLGKLYQKARADAPNLAARIDAEWQSGFAGNNGGFKFKVRDGDKPSITKGTTNPNTVGCWVLNLSTSLPQKFTYTDQYGLKLTDVMGQTIAPRTEIDPKLIKIGDYAHISISVKYNGKVDGTAGLYLSQSAIMLAAHGEAISSGPSLDEAFASIPMGALPAGASVASVAPAGMSTSPGLPAQQPLPSPATSVPGMSLGAAPAMPVAPAPVPAGAPSLPTASPTSAPVQPHTAFLQNAPVGLPLPGQG